MNVPDEAKINNDATRYRIRVNLNRFNKNATTAREKGIRSRRFSPVK